ncbi:hypothetical protein C9374_001427 [Naegleria lovaniensis]|uniref:C2 domain-containing protein n=1 Tax=Naegleria lovaniensis TaxID=51637 RepID=A0AA88KMQ9_NAELO|nr:uncharacterized protein C9374_001427 [Naegleria lovaniensis]KAG2387833.1 hypothetical protein C9374_001427 [Naegleria lovaniensis]
MAGLSLGSNPALETKVELYISCNNLQNKDLLSKSDPCCVVKIGERQLNGDFYWQDLGRTEVQKDNLNPKFTKTFIVTYKFEEIQPLKFLLYDIDNATVDLSDDDFLGSCEVKLSEIVCGPGGAVTKTLLAKHGNGGTITIRSEQKSKVKDLLVNLELDGKDLAKKDLFGKSDPYFILSKMMGNEYVDIYKSETIMNNLNPHWKGFTLPMQKLCNGNENLPLRIQVFDWDKHSDPDFIGSVDFTFQQLKQAETNRTALNIIDDGSFSKKKKPAKTTGKISVRKISFTEPEEEYTFLDYLGGGLEISLLVSIDFTASNGNPNDPNSLHAGGKFNEYEMAIKAIGDILAYYDSDKLFPSFGFGAKMPTGQVSHCFALNGNPSNPNSVGVDGILRDYRQALNTVELYGPTNFAPTIQTAVTLASKPPLSSANKIKNTDTINYY